MKDKKEKKDTVLDEIKLIRKDMDAWLGNICSATDSFNYCSRRLDRLLKKLKENPPPSES